MTREEVDKLSCGGEKEKIGRHLLRVSSDGSLRIDLALNITYISAAGDASEARRLRIQHHLIVDALGGLIACPLDLSHRHLRILDSGTADGYFLYELHKQLQDARSATLIGTDIESYPPIDDMPSNVHLLKQDILKPWPPKWRDSFDLVHQRTCMINATSMDKAVKVTKRLAQLVKPGGWLQLVEGYLPDGPIKPSDGPSTKMFKTVAALLKMANLDATRGARILEMLQRAGELENMHCRVIVARLGKGARTRELEEMGYAEIEGLFDKLLPWMESIPDQEALPMTAKAFKALRPTVLEEARTRGVEMVCYAAWGQRTQRLPKSFLLDDTRGSPCQSTSIN